MSRATVSVCKSCKAPILWALTVNGKTMPIDAEPSDRGTVVLHMEKGARYATVYTLTSRPEGVAYHVPHFVTCANAEQHRRRAQA